MTKPTVRYNATAGFFIEVGMPAFISTIDHPNTSNYADRSVKTSRVISHNEVTGDFETKNTKYVKDKKL